MADGNENERFLAAASKSALIREIDKNDQSLDHVKSVCSIVKDSLEREIGSIQDFLQKLLPSDILFDRECQVNNRVYFIVRLLLEDIGVSQALDRSRGRISIKLARALYTYADDRAEAEDRIQAYLQSKQTGTAQPSETIRISTTPNASSTNEGSSLSRNKAAVTSTFREDDKFSGSVSGNVPLHRIRNRFLDAIRDESIPRREEVSLLHCRLSGMALDFYYKQIRDILRTKEEAFEALEKRFNSPQHQAQARTYLSSLNIENIKEEKNCSNLKALETAHSRISDTVPNCRKYYQQESRYCDFLERVVQRQPWAHQVIQSRFTPSTNDLMDYNTFYSKLVAALTSWETLNQHNDGEHNQNDVSGSVFFGERYATKHIPRNRKFSRKDRISEQRKPDINSMIRGTNRVKHGMTASKLAQLKAKTRCLLCKRYGHWRQECPERHTRRTRDTMLTMVRQLGNDSAAVAKTLWAISEDDDEYFAYMETAKDAHTEDDVDELGTNPFEAIINSVEARPYDDEEATADLQTSFDEMAEQFVSYANMEEAPAFVKPSRF